MAPPDSPHTWDAHGRAWEVIHSRDIPSIPTGCPTTTCGDSAAIINGAQNTTTRPSPRVSRLPRDALGSLSTLHMRGTRTGGARGSHKIILKTTHDSHTPSHGILPVRCKSYQIFHDQFF